MAIGRFIAPLNGQNYTNIPYVDDIFDPLFNAEVRNYYNSIYGNNPLGRLAGIASGYGQMWENALTGKKGILGPGMGILGTFGRSMDKADDFLLGGLTESVNLIGRGLGGSNELPSNPLREIFVNDEDYQGTKLLAAMGNAISGLTGNQGIQLTENDFQSLGDKILGTGIDLATDPGILGSRLAKLNPNTPVGQVGNILNSYDDIMADVAGNLALPGAKSALKTTLNRIKDYLGNASSAPLKDVVINEDANASLEEMVEDIKTKTNLNPIDFPEEYAIYEDIRNRFNKSYLDAQKLNLNEQVQQQLSDQAKQLKYTAIKEKLGLNEQVQQQLSDQAKQLKYITAKENLKQVQQQLSNQVRQLKYTTVKEKLDLNKQVQQQLSNQAKQLKYTTAKENLKQVSQTKREFYTRSAFEGMKKHPSDFLGRTVRTSNLPDNWNSFDEGDFWNYVYAHLKEADRSKIKVSDATGKALSGLGDKIDYLEHLSENGASLEELKDVAASYLKETSYTKPSITFQPRKLGFISGSSAKNVVDVFEYHLENFLKKQPEGFRASKIKKEFGEDFPLYLDTKYVLDNTGKIKKYKSASGELKSMKDTIWDRLYNWGKLHDATTKKGTVYQTPDMTGNKLMSFLNSLQKVDTSDYIPGQAVKEELSGLIPWAFKNEYTLSKTQWGRDFLEFAHRLDEDIFKQIQYEDVVRYVSDPSMIEMNAGYKQLNQYFSRTTPLTKAEIEQYQKDFPYFDIYDTSTGERYLGSGKTPFVTVTPTSIINRLSKDTNLNSPKVLTKTVNEVSKLTPKDFAKTITNPLPLQTMSADKILSNITFSFKQEWNLPEDLPVEETGELIKKLGTPRQKTLFSLWDSAKETYIQNRTKQRSSALETEVAQRSKNTFDKIIASKKYTPENISEYITKADASNGAMLQGDRFLESIWASRGFKEIPFKNTPKAQVDAIAKQIKQNVNAVNRNGNILKFVDVTEADGTRRLGIYFDTDNINIKRDVSKLYGLFGKKDLGTVDVILRPKVDLKTAWNSTELDKAFTEMRTGTETLSTTLGFKNFEPNYIPHVMKEDEASATYFNNIYKSLGIDKKRLDSICSALQTEDIASGRLQFGAIPMERSHLGVFGQYKGAFSTDLSKIHSSAFTEGMLDNTNAQTFFGLFLTDNFKVKTQFKDVDTLKKALFIKDEAGKYTGNLDNLTLVRPRYDEHNKLIGFHRWDKFSDTELAKAFEDESTVLLPTDVLASLDRLCKKNARMDSKIYRFINKYLTVPFKFGTLANPGFLVGNIEDAYFKQAVELSKKYGTSLDVEFSNTAMSMRHVITLNNQMADIFKEYIGDKPLTPDIIMGDPKYLADWTKYVNENLKGADLQKARLYNYINSYQNVNLFKKDLKNMDATSITRDNNLLDLEEVNDMMTTNPYNVPNNIVERIFYGNASKKGINSYGLMLNNPVSNRILKSSNQIETLMRSATILNDLEHRGYTMDKIESILELPKGMESKVYQDLNMAMNEAINTMHTANFDYDNVTELMNKASYILPFPTFYLKNMGFWADVFVNKPQIVDNVISVHEGLWSGKDTKDEFVAEAKGRGAIPIGQQGNKHLTGIVKQSPYNSMFGAFNAVNSFQEDFAYRTNPVLRPIARHLQPKENIRYRPYSFNQYEKNIKYGDPKFSDLAYMFHQLNPYERILNTYLRTPGKVARNDWQLSDFTPSLFQPDFKK